MKKGLKKTTTGSPKSRLAIILLAYQTTPHSTTGNTPAKLLLGRNLHTRLDLLKPNTAAHVESKQWNQKVSHDNSIPAPSFTVGQSVLIRVYGQNHKWTRGSICVLAEGTKTNSRVVENKLLHHHKTYLILYHLTYYSMFTLS